MFTPKRLGTQSVKLANPPSILSSYSIVGKKEKEGPLSDYFDYSLDEGLWGEKTWEKAESKIVREAVNGVLSKSGLNSNNINYIFAGDLINQCTSSSFALKDSNIPFYGLYGACSTMAESLSLAAMVIDGGFAEYSIACTSSHFCSAERQFRLPLEYGGQRTPTSQWTVTGAGALALSNEGNGPYITHITTGKIVDYEIKDANNMGAAMAPAAVDTIYTHFQDLKILPEYYDLIITGDLASIGAEILKEMLLEKGIDIYNCYTDCGLEIYDNGKQDTHAGGSGCGCSAVVLAGYILKEMKKKKYNRVLFVATGALMSPLSMQQGGTIPSIAHAVTISNYLE